MAIGTYTELRSAVARWLLDRTDITDRIPEFIELAEAQMNRRLRVRQMIRRAEAALVEEFTEGPTDLLAPVQLTLEIAENDIRFLEQLSPESLLKEKAKMGTVLAALPVFYSAVGTSLQLLPQPDQAYTGELVYYGKIPPLASNATNWLLSLYPDCYLHGALAQAAGYLVDDEKLATWSALFNNALNEIQTANRVPSGNLRVDPALLTTGANYDIRTGE